MGLTYRKTKKLGLLNLKSNDNSKSTAVEASVIRLTTPISESQARELKAGDEVLCG